MDQTLCSKLKCSLTFLLLLLLVLPTGGQGAGECGQTPVGSVALQLAPCAAASQSVRAPVSPSCCAEVQKLGQNPKCLCAVMLSSTAKSAGVKPEVAITIPKRCNLTNRPVGYKCGSYTLP